MASEQPSPNPLPPACQPIIDRMLDAGIFRERPDQLTINIYEPGNGIPSHVDTHSAFSETIASLSLLSGSFASFLEKSCENHIRYICE